MIHCTIQAIEIDELQDVYEIIDKTSNIDFISITDNINTPKNCYTILVAFADQIVGELNLGYKEPAKTMKSFKMLEELSKSDNPLLFQQRVFLQVIELAEQGMFYQN